MAKPNSLTTSLRLMAVRIIDPMPPVGEAWCMYCSLNGGLTKSFPFTELTDHLDVHIGKNGETGNVSIRGMEKHDREDNLQA